VALPHTEQTVLIPLYAAALFLSSVLLFSVQPMFAKMVLPPLGGSPAVWNTAQVFLQATLLLGYLYAHILVHVFPLRMQVICHIVLLAGILSVVSIGISPAAAPPVQGTPVLWFLQLLLVTVGIPFFFCPLDNGTALAEVVLEDQAH
jgi:hypothetical protein